MSWANWIPLVLAVFVVLPVLLAPVNVHADRVVSRFALLIFGTYASSKGRNKAIRKKQLRAAHMPTTYRTYSAKTMLYSAVFAVAGTVASGDIRYHTARTWIVVSDAALTLAGHPRAEGGSARTIGLPACTPAERFCGLPPQRRP